MLILSLTGCGSSGDTPLIVATTWSLTERTQIAAAYHEQSGDRQQIVWLALAPGERLDSVLDRRGGVDVLLGGPPSAYARLGRSGRLAGTNPIGPSSWRAVRRPAVNDRSIVKSPSRFGDPRRDPESFALARSTLLTEGWPKGYETLVRAAARSRATDGGPDETALPLVRPEGVALLRGGPNPDRATKFLQALESQGLAETPPDKAIGDAAADELLADLLGSALIDSLDELREAQAALVRFGHPAQAEAAIGERPPWPPASVAKLLADPNAQPMVETLLEQVAPDPESRAWLVESWSKPKRPVDGELLAEVARAADGNLSREPRFRAWLRGEWTAWTRQLYRRVARVAGGYIPS